MPAVASSGISSQTTNGSTTVSAILGNTNVSSPMTENNIPASAVFNNTLESQITIVEEVSSPASNFLEEITGNKNMRRRSLLKLTSITSLAGLLKLIPLEAIAKILSAESLTQAQKEEIQKWITELLRNRENPGVVESLFESLVSEMLDKSQQRIEWLYLWNVYSQILASKEFSGLNVEFQKALFSSFIYMAGPAFNDGYAQELLKPYLEEERLLKFKIEVQKEILSSLTISAYGYGSSFCFEAISPYLKKDKFLKLDPEIQAVIFERLIWEAYGKKNRQAQDILEIYLKEGNLFSLSEAAQKVIFRELPFYAYRDNNASAKKIIEYYYTEERILTFKEEVQEAIFETLAFYAYYHNVPYARLIMDPYIRNFDNLAMPIRYGILKGMSRKFEDLDAELRSFVLTHTQNLPIAPENDALFSDVYSGVHRWINNIHDRYETSKWKEQINDFLSKRSYKEMYLLTSYGTFELYTGTFNLLYEELVKRVKEGGGLLKWLGQMDKEGVISTQFLLALSSRDRLMDIIRKTTDGGEQEIVKVFRQTADLIERAIIKNFSSRTELSRINLAYIANAIKELFDYGNLEIRDYLKGIILRAEKQENIYAKIFSLIVMYKYQFMGQQEFRLLSLKGKQIFKVIDYLNKPAYKQLVKQGNKLVILIDYAYSAEKYLDELKNLFAKDLRYNLRYNLKQPTRLQKEEGIEYIIEGQINGMVLEYHLAKKIQGSSFKRLIESGRYSLIFTRHHSYEGKDFAGVGSDKVLPQLLGTIATGQGIENNLFAIVLSEELAKGVSNNTSWDGIWQAIKNQNRMDLNNFIAPNHLSLLMSYALEIKEETDVSVGQDIGSVVIVDGGCGGINRLPKYIPKYHTAINIKTGSSSSPANRLTDQPANPQTTPAASPAQKEGASSAVAGDRIEFRSVSEGTINYEIILPLVNKQALIW